MGQRTERFFERAKKFLEASNNEQALRLFNQVLNREPGHKGALKQKALLLIDSASPKKVEEFLQLALEQHPKESSLRQIAGSFYISIQKFEQAHRHLQKSVELKSQNALAHYRLGIISARHHADHQQAITHFDEAIAQNPNLSEALFGRGCSYMIEGAMNKAEQDFRDAKKLDHDKAIEMLETHFNS
jgi:tetratricopeptide (TPR) repeat protein